MYINFTKVNNFKNELEIYRQTNEICPPLKLTSLPYYMDIYNLFGNFSVLDNVKNRSFIHSLFPGISNQIIVSECSFAFLLAQQSDPNYLNISQSLYEQRGWFLQYGFQLIIPAIIAFLSIILNISLVIVIVKKIPFIKICNSLILFDSACQIPIVLPFLINFIAFFLGKTVIDFHICLFVLMLSTGCSFASFMTIFLISLERLLNLAFPIRMHSISLPTIKKYSILAYAICIFFGFCMILSSFNFHTSINMLFARNVFCHSDLYLELLTVNTSYILLLSSIANYFIIFGILLWRHIQRGRKTKNSVGNAATGNEQLAKSTMPRGTRRKLRSVLIISVVIFVGWVLGSAARKQCLGLLHNLFEKICLSFSISYTDMVVYMDMTYVLSGFFTCFSIIAAGINAPILLIMSPEYRKAYKETFSRINICRQQQNNSFGPLFTIQNNAAER